MNATISTRICTPGRLQLGASAFKPSLPSGFHSAIPSRKGPSFATYASSPRGRSSALSIHANYIWTLHSFPCKDAASNPEGVTENCNLDQPGEQELSISALIEAHGGRDYVTLGSSDAADIVLQWEQVGGEHVKLIVSGDNMEKLYIEDMDSDKGTTIDSQSLPPGTVCELVPGQVVKLGSTKTHDDDEKNIDDAYTFVVERNVVAHA